MNRALLGYKLSSVCPCVSFRAVAVVCVPYDCNDDDGRSAVSAAAAAARQSWCKDLMFEHAPVAHVLRLRKRRRQQQYSSHSRTFCARESDKGTDAAIAGLATMTFVCECVLKRKDTDEYDFVIVALCGIRVRMLMCALATRLSARKSS